MNTIAVAIVDDDMALRLVVRHFLHRTPGFSCAGWYECGRHALRDFGQSQAQVALIDLFLPDIDGLQCAQQLQRRFPACKFIIFSGLADPSGLEAARQAGADGYLCKPVPAGVLAQSIRAALAGQFPYYHGALEFLAPAAAPPERKRLLFADLARKALFATPAPEGQSLRAVVRAAHFQVEPLAALCDISRRQLLRDCHRVYHETTRHLLLDSRMGEASVLLGEDVSIKECAHQTGYAYEANFCAEFHRYFHCTPTERRTQLRQGGASAGQA